MHLSAKLGELMRKRRLSSDSLAIERPSLITATAERLRRAITEKRWSEALPSERKLTELMQVSRPTLRAALKILLEEGRITALARRKYLLKVLPRKQKASQVGKIVLLSPFTLEELEIRIPAVFTWIDYLRELLTRANYTFEIECRRACFSQKPQRALEGLATESAPDCWLLYRSTPVMQEWFASHRLHHIVLGSTFAASPVSSIDLDFDAICRHAAQQMGRLGHRHVAYLTQKTRLAGDESSKREFARACEQFRSHPMTSLALEHDGTREGACRIIDQFLKLKPRPTAILSAYTQQTISIVSRLLQRNCQIPNDVSVVCRDNHPVLGFVSPSLARYEWNQRTYASKLFRLIQSVLHNGPDYAMKVRLVPEYIAGESLASPGA